MGINWGRLEVEATGSLRHKYIGIDLEVFGDCQ